MQGKMVHSRRKRPAVWACFCIGGRDFQCHSRAFHQRHKRVHHPFPRPGFHGTHRQKFGVLHPANTKKFPGAVDKIRAAGFQNFLFIPGGLGRGAVNAAHPLVAELPPCFRRGFRHRKNVFQQLRIHPRFSPHFVNGGVQRILRQFLVALSIYLLRSRHAAEGNALLQKGREPPRLYVLKADIGFLPIGNFLKDQAGHAVVCGKTWKVLHFSASLFCPIIPPKQSMSKREAFPESGNSIVQSAYRNTLSLY